MLIIREFFQEKMEVLMGAADFFLHI